MIIKDDCLDIYYYLFNILADVATWPIVEGVGHIAIKSYVYEVTLS